jgi:chitinase
MCAGLLTTSSSAWPEMAPFQISANGVLLDKLMISKPGMGLDASNGYIDPLTLTMCVRVAEAASEGWSESPARLIILSERILTCLCQVLG